jgi:hypothetical protein
MKEQIGGIWHKRRQVRHVTADRIRNTMFACKGGLSPPLNGCILWGRAITSEALDLKRKWRTISEPYCVLTGTQNSLNDEDFHELEYIFKSPQPGMMDVWLGLPSFFAFDKTQYARPII